MGLVSKSWILKQLGINANTCTVTTVSTAHGTDEYRLETDTTVDYDDINCHVQILSEEDDSVKQGEARAGDLVFWFDYAQESYCSNGNKITFDSKTYQIYDVHNFDVSGVTMLIECRTRKI